MQAEELQEQLIQHIKNNIQLSEYGLKPLTIEIQGSHGIGKSQIAERVVKEAVGPDGVLIYISSAQLEDSSDWVGLPSIDVILSKSGEEDITVPSHIASPFLSLGWKYVSNVSTIKPPDWVKKIVPYKTVILIDDYTRANPVIMQALMAFLLEQKLGSWSCPPGVTILLTTNPQSTKSSKYQVSALDDAQATRKITYNLEFNATSWAKWARKQKNPKGEVLYPDILVDFMVQNERYFNQICPRSYTMFMQSFVTDPELKNRKFLDKLALTLGVDFRNALFVHLGQNTDRVLSPEEFREKTDSELVEIFNKYHTKKAPEKQASFMQTLMDRIKSEKDWQDNEDAWIYQAQRALRLKLISGDIAFNFSKELCVLNDGPQLSQIFAQ